MRPIDNDGLDYGDDDGESGGGGGGCGGVTMTLASLPPAAAITASAMPGWSTDHLADQVPSLHLCIVIHGVAAKAGTIITYGGHWGEDMIVTARVLRDLRPANALSYLEVPCGALSSNARPSVRVLSFACPPRFRRANHP